MRILVISNIYPPYFIGGAELIAHEQVKKLSEQGHELLVFCGRHVADGPHGVTNDIFEGISLRRVALSTEDCRGDAVNFYHPRVNDLFLETLTDFQPDVVYSHNLAGLGASLPLIARHRGYPVVQMLHDHWGYCFKNTLLKSGTSICNDFSACRQCMPVIADGKWRGLPIEVRNDYMSLVLAQSSAVIAPSRFLADSYTRAGVIPSDIITIPYGIDTERFGHCRRHPDGAIRFTFIGYLGEHKGVWPLVHAAARLRDLGVDSRVVIQLVGTGHTEPALRQFCEQNGLQNRVQFAGRVTNGSIDAVLETSDALILPSIWPENQPVTILEAMAAGLPVIASAVGGIPEMIDDGQTGLLVAPDDPIALARQIAYLADQPALRAEMGQRAREKVRPWSLTNQIMRLEEVFAAVQLQPYPAIKDQRPVVVCHGLHFNSDARTAIGIMRNSARSNAPRFVFGEWLDPSDRARAAVHWVTGDIDAKTDLHQLTEAGVPLVVPACIKTLVDYCRQHSAGLWYRDGEEAAAAISMLLDDRDLANHVEENSLQPATYITRT